ADKAKAIIRKARVVASDETGVRIEGTNSYHWVFHCKDAVVHQPDYSRGTGLRGKFPANREFNREFYKNRAVWRNFTRQNAAESVSCRTIPYKMKQGIY